MTLYQGMLIFYAVVALVATLITFFIAKDKLSIKLLSAFLVGATWPMSFPVARWQYRIRALVSGAV